MRLKELQTAIRTAVEEAQRSCNDSKQVVISIIHIPGESFDSPLHLKASESKEMVTFDRPWKGLFIAWLKKGRAISKAAELSGVTRRHAHHCRQVDALFREEWGKAKSYSSRHKTNNSP